mmetsp:Transcript_12334/g.49676  ORF Transcript_12334/g.49676 Transcript_12334/m.49676 type:complete len:213 (+) Transcript_12334:1070-1708(+)
MRPRPPHRSVVSSCFCEGEPASSLEHDVGVATSAPRRPRTRRRQSAPDHDHHPDSAVPHRELAPTLMSLSVRRDNRMISRGRDIDLSVIPITHRQSPKSRRGRPAHVARHADAVIEVLGDAATSRLVVAAVSTLVLRKQQLCGAPAEPGVDLGVRADAPAARVAHDGVAVPDDLRGSLARRRRLDARFAVGGVPSPQLVRARVIDVQQLGWS